MRRGLLPVVSEFTAPPVIPSYEHATRIRCDTSDDNRGRGTINLSACDIGEWFSSEY